jgi:hypothetical protein
MEQAVDTVEQQVTYDSLVDELSAVLVRRYGSVAEFTRNKDFLDLGYTLRDSDKVQTYFATPKSGVRRTKSAKLMVKLAKKYLNRTIRIRTEVLKVQYLIEEE